VPRRDILIILGDFNARLGVENKGVEQVMGNCAMNEKQNTNGEKLLEFCLINNLIIQSTRFPHRDIHKGTWRHPGTGAHHHQHQMEILR
jgi:hypothetical protein